MNVGIIGLGRMGSAVAFRLLQSGHTVYGFDAHQDMQQEATKMGVKVVDSVAAIAEYVRALFLFVPAGDPVDAIVSQLRTELKRGDIIIDGGNSNYADSMRHEKDLSHDGIIFLDCGTSGGVHGKENGFCLMIGGDKAAYTKIHQLLVAIAAPGGVAHVGPSGAGHYVKMVHNGIEYALLQAYAEGFHLIKDGSFKDQSLDLEQIARIWSVSSVIRSWILDLTHQIFEQDQKLEDVAGDIAESGMGQWTVEDAHKHNVPVKLIEDSLSVRAWSRDTGGNYATKIVALLRNKFGGHTFKKVED